MFFYSVTIYHVSNPPYVGGLHGDNIESIIPGLISHLDDSKIEKIVISGKDENLLITIERRS